MSKFKKRIQKSFSTEVNVLVYGTGFGFLEDILDLFPSVFLIAKEHAIKRKNLIFREEDNDISNISNIGIIFLDRSLISKIDYILPIIIKNRPIILIEGNTPIEREFSKSLYDNGYLCKDTQGFYHMWKKIK